VTQVVDFVKTWRAEGSSLVECGSRLCDEALAPRKDYYKGAGLDNMTVMIVDFKR
jgi:serine/threonine protein phosphatase PrpC